jgi:hypothetical protein
MDKHQIKANELEERYQKIISNGYKIDKLEGCSDLEIKNIQLKYDVTSPRSYYTFLRKFGKYPSYLLGNIDLEYPHPLTQTEELFYPMLLSDPQDNYIAPSQVPEKIFVLANYYGEKLYFFILNENSEVFLAESCQGNGEIFKYKKVADSIWELVESIIKYLEKRYKIDTQVL